jgi:hypothetical protein
MLARFRHHAVWIEMAVTFGAALSVYVSTLPPGLTWRHFGVDGAELVTASVTLGVPHPPGYPTYVLLGKLFSLLPIGPIAYRFNLFSAVCTAAAASVVTATAALQLRAAYRFDLFAAVRTAAVAGVVNATTDLQLRPRRTDSLERGMIAIAVGLSVAFAGLVWSQALIAEVYGLNLLLLALLLWALVGGRPPFLIGFLLGVSLTTHLTSIFFAPLVLLRTPRSKWHFVLCGTVVGLLPYLLIFWLARGSSPVVWGDPETLDRWWWLVSGHGYRGFLFQLPAEQAVARLSEWGVVLLTQFTLLGAPLLALGGYAQWHGDRQGRWWVLGVVGTAALFTVYAFSYNTWDAIILLLPVVLVSALLLAPALNFVDKFGLLLPLSLLLLNFNVTNLHRAVDVGRKGIELAEALPPHAIVVTPGDATIFTLWYVQYVEGVRPDLILIDSKLFTHGWYRQQLQQAYPTLQAVMQDDLDALAAASKAYRPVCRVSLGRPTLAEQIDSCD